MKMKQILTAVLTLAMAAPALAHGDHHAHGIMATIGHYLSSVTHLPVPMLIGATAIAAVLLIGKLRSQRLPLIAAITAVTTIFSIGA